MKPAGELFNDVSDVAYQVVLDYLRELHHRYPASSERDLMLFALTQIIDKDMKVD